MSEIIRFVEVLVRSRVDLRATLGFALGLFAHISRRHVSWKPFTLAVCRTANPVVLEETNVEECLTSRKKNVSVTRCTLSEAILASKSSSTPR